MRILLVFFLVLISTLINAAEVPLRIWDQEKLAQLVLRLPDQVKRVAIEPLISPLEGQRIFTEFPKGEQGFKFLCESDFYSDSAYPSRSACELSLDESHPDYDANYDEARVELKDIELSKALFESISYGRPNKEFRSGRRRWGTNYNGRSAYILDYYFTCSLESCLMRFSAMN